MTMAWLMQIIPYLFSAAVVLLCVEVVLVSSIARGAGLKRPITPERAEHIVRTMTYALIAASLASLSFITWISGIAGVVGLAFGLLTLRRLSQKA